jgi:transposase
MSRDGANAVRFILQSLPFQPERTFHRTPLPDHLPRDDVGLDIDDMTRTCCGVELRT